MHSEPSHDVPAGRRGPSGRIFTAAVVVAALLLLVLMVRDAGRRSSLPPPRIPGPPHRTVASGPLPTSLPTPTATVIPVQRSRVVLPWQPESTPTEAPWPTEPAPPRRAEAKPTESVERCVAIDWRSSLSLAAPGQVLIDIDAHNGCGRDLAALEVWFEVSGFHQGALVRSVTGHLFDPLYRGGDGHATIALPGSIDWYDTIEVTLKPVG